MPNPLESLRIDGRACPERFGRCNDLKFFGDRRGKQLKIFRLDQQAGHVIVLRGGADKQIEFRQEAL